MKVDSYEVLKYFRTYQLSVF